MPCSIHGLGVWTGLAGAEASPPPTHSHSPRALLRVDGIDVDRGSHDKAVVGNVGAVDLKSAQRREGDLGLKRVLRHARSLCTCKCACVLYMYVRVHEHIHELHCVMSCEIYRVAWRGVAWRGAHACETNERSAPRSTTPWWSSKMMAGPPEAYAFATWRSVVVERKEHSPPPRTPSAPGLSRESGSFIDVSPR